MGTIKTMTKGQHRGHLRLAKLNPPLAPLYRDGSLDLDILLEKSKIELATPVPTDPAKRIATLFPLLRAALIERLETLHAKWHTKKIISDDGAKKLTEARGRFLKDSHAVCTMGFKRARRMLTRLNPENESETHPDCKSDDITAAIYLINALRKICVSAPGAGTGKKRDKKERGTLVCIAMAHLAPVLAEEPEIRANLDASKARTEEKNEGGEFNYYPEKYHDNGAEEQAIAANFEKRKESLDTFFAYLRSKEPASVVTLREFGTQMWIEDDMDGSINVSGPCRPIMKKCHDDMVRTVERAWQMRNKGHTPNGRAYRDMLHVGIMDNIIRFIMYPPIK